MAGATGAEDPSEAPSGSGSTARRRDDRTAVRATAPGGTTRNTLMRERGAAIEGRRWRRSVAQVSWVQLCLRRVSGVKARVTQ